MKNSCSLTLHPQDLHPENKAFSALSLTASGIYPHIYKWYFCIAISQLFSCRHYILTPRMEDKNQVLNPLPQHTEILTGVIKQFWLNQYLVLILPWPLKYYLQLWQKVLNFLYFSVFLNSLLLFIFPLKLIKVIIFLSFLCTYQIILFWTSLNIMIYIIR